MQKIVIENQPRLGVENGWYSEFPRENREIEKDAEKVKEYSKREWKKIFKEKIDKNMGRISKVKKQERYEDLNKIWNNYCKTWTDYYMNVNKNSKDITTPKTAPQIQFLKC